jgi:DnaK suppressor protein
MKIKHYKKKLEEDKANLESEMESVGRRKSGVPGDWEAVPTETGMESDIVDQADIVMSRENNTAILADLEARYDTVLEALKRIDNEKYGKCEVCNEEIEEARLEADASATTCIKHL